MASASQPKQQPNPDGIECEKTLGKPPQPPNLMSVSDNVVNRLKTGAVDEEQCDAYDNYWLEKLACMDKSHGVRNKLNIDSIESILKYLGQFAKHGTGKKCPIDRQRLVDCYIMNKDAALKCADEVKHFTDCVDKLLYAKIHTDPASASATRKASYAAKFERGY